MPSCYINNSRKQGVRTKETITIAHYRRKAKEMDAKYNGIPNEENAPLGPFSNRLAALGGIRPLVFGRFSEVNDGKFGVSSFLKGAAWHKARRVSMFISRGSLDVSDHSINAFYKTFFAQYKRVISTAAAYSKAKLLLERKVFVGLKKEQYDSTSRAFIVASGCNTRPFSSFKRDYFGEDTGTHFYSSRE